MLRPAGSAVAPTRPSVRPARPPRPTRTSTTSRSDRHRGPAPLTAGLPATPGDTHAAPHEEARRLLPRSPAPEGLLLLRRQDRRDRLQGGQPPPPVPLGAREDRAAPEDRDLRRAPARAGGRAQARTPRGAPPVRASAPPPLTR